jgi:hypothetical protein
VSRAASLALLAAWRIAQEPRNLRSFRVGRSQPLDESSAFAARSHGLAAVRAIRFKPYTGPLAEAYAIRFIREESRLAVRAALNAVGLKTL